MRQEPERTAGGLAPKVREHVFRRRRRGVCGRRMAPRESLHTLHAARRTHALGNGASAPRLAFTSAARQQGIPSCDLCGRPDACIWRFPGPPDRDTYWRRAFGI